MNHSFSDQSRKIRLAHQGIIDRSAAVIVWHGSSILMGRRRDTGRWTLPGGGVNDDESAHEGALRELREETGIPATSLELLGWKLVRKRNGEPIKVFTYMLETYDHPTWTEEDPDKEVTKWEWVEVRDKRLPKGVRENLQHNPNAALIIAGLD